MRSIESWCLGLATLALLASPAGAAETSVVLDPVGELPAFCLSVESCPAESFTIPLFQDIVRAAVSKKDQVFSFVIDVADEIPASPPLEPSGVKLLEWSFRLDLDPTTFTHGYPFSPAPIGDFADIMVFVMWDGVGFTASVIDRRPSLTGGEAVVTPVPFDIKKGQITVWVDAGLISDPPSFLWRAWTEDWTGQLGTDSWKPLDIVPSGSHIFALWPADLTSTELGRTDLSSANLSSTAAGGTKLCLVNSDCPGTQTCDTTTCVQPPKQCKSQGTCDLCWGVCVGDKSECRPRCHF